MCRRSLPLGNIAKSLCHRESAHSMNCSLHQRHNFNQTLWCISLLHVNGYSIILSLHPQMQNAMRAVEFVTNKKIKSGDGNSKTNQSKRIQKKNHSQKNKYAIPVVVVAVKHVCCQACVRSTKACTRAFSIFILLRIKK